MIHNLKIDISLNDTVVTSMGFEFQRTKNGYLDKISNIEWHMDFKTGINHYQATEWATLKKMRLPTKEEFREAEAHGIRELPNMKWSFLSFWSSSLHNFHFIAYVFDGNDGYADGFEWRSCHTDQAARCIQQLE